MAKKEREKKERGRRSQGVLSSSDVYVPAEKREEKGYVGDGTDLPHDGGVLPASRKEGTAKSLPTFQNQAVVQNPTPMAIRYDKPEIPQYGGTIQASSTQTARKQMPSLQGRAVVQNSTKPGIIIRKKSDNNYGGMIEPAVVTAERTQNGGELQASEVSAEEKTMPSLQGKAIVQNPSDIGKMPEVGEYGGELPAATKQAAGVSLPDIQGKAVVMNTSDIGRMPNPPQYGGEIAPSIVTAERTITDEIAPSEIIAEGKTLKELPKAQAEALKKEGIIPTREYYAESIQEEDETTPEDGGEIAASKKIDKKATMPSLQANAEAMTQAGISSKRYRPDELPYDPDSETLPDLQGKAVEQNPSDIGKMPRPISRIETPENMIAKAQTADKTGIIDGKAETKEEEKEQADEAKNVISSLDDMIKELEEERKRAKEEDQVAARRSRNMQLVSGISDALSALANLIGVSKGASHIELKGTTGPLAERFDALRKERKADIKDINNRLEQKLKERMEMQREFARDAESKRRWEAEFGFKKDRAAKQDEQWESEQTFKQDQAETQKNQWQQTFDANQEERKQKADQWQKDYELRSNQIQAENELVQKRYEEAVRSNKANEANAYRNYSLALKKFQEEQKENEYSLSVDNETFKVSKYDLTNGTVDPLFNSLPDEFKALASDVDPEDRALAALGGKMPKAPTLEAKLGAVTTYIQQNPDDENAQALANSLRKMAGKAAKQYPKKEQSAQQGTGKLDEFK